MSESDTVGLRLSTLEAQQQEMCVKLDRVHDAVLIMQNRRIYEGGAAPLCEQHGKAIEKLQGRADSMEYFAWRITGGLVVFGLLLSLFAPNLRALLRLGGTP
jgi:hypothetical protein